MCHVTEPSLAEPCSKLETFPNQTLLSSRVTRTWTSSADWVKTENHFSPTRVFTSANDKCSIQLVVKEVMLPWWPVHLDILFISLPHIKTFLHYLEVLPFWDFILRQELCSCCSELSLKKAPSKLVTPPIYSTSPGHNLVNWVKKMKLSLEVKL